MKGKNILLWLAILICVVYSNNNHIYSEDYTKAPGIPSLEIRDISCPQFTKINIGMTGKVNEVIIERKSGSDENYKEVYTKKSDEAKEFRGTEWYDEDIRPGRKYIYRIYSRLNGKQSPKSKGSEYKIPYHDDWYYPSRKAKAVQFSDMPKVDVKPQQIGIDVVKIIIARLLPEKTFGPDIVYVKFVKENLPEDAYYGIYKMNKQDDSGRFTVLWEDSMKETYDIDWGYSGRFFLCDVTGDGVDEIGFVLISGNQNLQRVYFFNSEEEFRCIFMNKFNVNAYVEKGDWRYKIKPPEILIGGDSVIKTANGEPMALPVAPRKNYWRVYGYEQISKKFIQIGAKES